MFYILIDKKAFQQLLPQMKGHHKSIRVTNQTIPFLVSDQHG